MKETQSKRFLLYYYDKKKYNYFYKKYVNYYYE